LKEEPELHDHSPLDGAARHGAMSSPAGLLPTVIQQNNPGFSGPAV
jgi:hypothetical protein